MRVALVGGSGHGHQHLQFWRKLAEVESLTVVGRSPERLAALAGEFGVSTTTDLAAVLGEVDLVDICTPTDTHHPLASAALAAGVPVIVEKPACRTVDEARALGELAGETPLFCVANFRFSPVWRRVRELLTWGAIGRPRLSLWPVLADNRHLMQGEGFRADAARGGGCLLDGAYHLVDLIPWLMQQPYRGVSAWMGRLAAQPPAGEDTALAIYELSEGVAQLTYSWAVANPARTPAATIVGDEATLLVPRSARQPLELIRNRETSEVDLGSFRAMARNDMANCLQHYVDCLRNHTAPEATWADAVATQTVVEATERAAAEGRRVEL